MSPNRFVMVDSIVRPVSCKPTLTTKLKDSYFAANKFEVQLKRGKTCKMLSSDDSGFALLQHRTRTKNHGNKLSDKKAKR